MGNIFTQVLSVPKINLDDRKSQIIFQQNTNQQFGFDDFRNEEWVQTYDTLNSLFLKEYIIPYKSQALNSNDKVNAWIRNIGNFNADSLVFKIKKTNAKIYFVQKNDSIVVLTLPKMKTNYTIVATYKGYKLGELKVAVYSLKEQKIIIVPLTNHYFNKDSLEKRVNEIYKQANIQLNFSYLPKFASKHFDDKTLFDNPSPTNDRYTNQMRDFRNIYFERHPNADKKAFYVFIVPGFVSPSINGYMPRNKAMAFVKVNSDKKFANTVARELAFGIGMLEDSWRNDGPPIRTTLNLMDNTFGTELSHDQWEKLRHSTHSFSFYDSDEDIRTNNGLVAYYFWKVDEKGNIELKNTEILQSINRPYKKNYLSYHLDIRDFFYQTIFKVGNVLISLWHVLAFLGIFSSAFFIRRRFHRFIKKKLKKPRLLKFTSRITLILSACMFYYWIFLLIDRGYERFEIKSGKLNDLFNQSTDQAVNSILYNSSLKHKSESELRSEILIKKNGNWFVKKKRRVLYFTVRQDPNKAWNICHYSKDNDSLILSYHDYKEIAESHYMVFDYRSKEGKLINQKVYNHLGVDISNKLNADDPAKRILVFVNGYRPTSVGHSFEDNFEDIQNNGFEFPQTNNLIYNFDRYDYWRPWKEIDLKFKKRINPSETFYADGHFSVATSNHQSLVNFTTVSAVYPKRCKNKNKHTCGTTTLNGSGLFGPKTVKTTDLLRTQANENGFNERVKNGRIAGRNLLQIFNELPNKSNNDTLYIVAHSMGFAYSIGILKELRGRINFGGFYILAAENASTGHVSLNEWQEVWQYGSDFNKKTADAPCLQDGVAAQAKVGGLSSKHRTYIPADLYNQKGFFDSHFVGYYTWILNLEKGKTGYVRQR